jgi:hypothetical protein
LFDSVALVKSQEHGSVEQWGTAMKSGRMARAYVTAAVIAALFATNAAAATLSNVEGKVSVNRGGGFQPASTGTALSSGDRVRASSSGSANIVYENGCSTRVGPSQVAVVLATPPACQGASLVGYAPAGFDPGADTLIVGGLIVGAGVGIAVAASNDNNSTTYYQVSP